MLPSDLLHARMPAPYVRLHPEDARKLKVKQDDAVEVTTGGVHVLATAQVDETVPEGFVLAPRSMGIPLNGPSVLTIRTAEKMAV